MQKKPFAVAPEVTAETNEHANAAKIYAPSQSSSPAA
jgi:hypothetical protein